MYIDHSATLVWMNIYSYTTVEAPLMLVSSRKHTETGNFYMIIGRIDYYICGGRRIYIRMHNAQSPCLHAFILSDYCTLNLNTSNM